LISYFDTSALVKNYVEEVGSDDVHNILLDTLPATSRLTGIELASSVARRCREGDLSQSDSDKILSEVREDLTALYVVELTPDVERTAQGVLFRHSLRAADAIHLASCLVLREHLDVPMRFIAYDRRLLDAAVGEGFETFGV
jgi:predicted nucleic acid-binding protein